MQSIHLLRELNAVTSSKSKGISAILSPRESHEENDSHIQVPVKVYPPAASKSTMDKAKCAIEDEVEEPKEMQSLGLLRQLRAYSNGSSKRNAQGRSILKEATSSFESLAKEEIKDQSADNLMSEEENYVEEPIVKRRRRRLFPNEVLDEIIGFFSHGDCHRAYTVNLAFHQLIEPRRKLVFKLFMERVEETRVKLEQTIKEVNQRREHVNQLNDQIGVLNARVIDIGDQLSNLDANIKMNHQKLDELFIRVRKIRAKSPEPKKEE